MTRIGKKGIIKSMEEQVFQMTIEKENQDFLLDKIKKSCAFTGHREVDENFSILLLKESIKNLIKKGVKTFYCGMAKGFDLLAGKQVILLKEEFEDIRLIACIPFYGQEKNFSQKEKELYVEIYNKSDEKVIISQKYYKGCTLTRNRYMADNADILFAYLKKQTGGTAYTVNYFKKKYPQKEIIFI